jgi:ribonucleotide monophosphatase NagD (HAD superfamily)
MGIDANMDTALVFTGETSPDMVAATPPDERPTYALDRIDRLIPPHLWPKFGWTEENG